MRTALVTIVLAVGLTLLFWGPLWQGGGLVGGDIYSYYMPQKVLYAESLAAGDIPTWNNRVGFGYPLVGESQTGVYYPLHLICYRLLEINTAYNVNHLLHYVIAFLGVVAYARAIKLTLWGALLAALVYVYAWFPSRCCWEWAIIGGAWFPVALWLVECYRSTAHWRHLFSLAIVLALQMLAGHFNIAFITQLTLALYVLLRFWLCTDESKVACKKGIVVVATMMACSFALAAIQLIPTWELKNLSQRATAGSNHNLAHGSIPPAYWSQAILPWKFYAPEFNRDQWLQKFAAQIGAPTNQVEAHLYFGLIPLGLACLGLIAALHQRNRLFCIWAGLGIVTFLYTSGMLLVVTRHVPGFSFFQGPGRFGLVTTLAVGLLAGFEFDRLGKNWKVWPLSCWAAITTAAIVGLLLLVDSTWNFAEATESIPILIWQGIPISGELCLGLLVIVLPVLLLLLYESIRGGSFDRPVFKALVASLGVLMFAITAFDLWTVGRLVTYSTMVADAPIKHLDKSPLRQIFSPESNAQPRINAAGANLPTVLGVSAVPTYFTFGPAVYSDKERMLPTEGDPQRVDWLQKASVEFELTTDPKTNIGNNTQLIWQGMDSVLNSAWGQYDRPLSLYRLPTARPRAGFVDQGETDSVAIQNMAAESVSIQTSSNKPGRLYLTDLSFPGWQVTIDGQPAEALLFEEMFRAVDVPAGEHTVVWRYRPASLQWGMLISTAAALLLAALAHIRFWHPNLLTRQKNHDTKPGT